MIIFKYIPSFTCIRVGNYGIDTERDGYFLKLKIEFYAREYDQLYFQHSEGWLFLQILGLVLRVCVRVYMLSTFRDVNFYNLQTYFYLYAIV